MAQMSQLLVLHVLVLFHTLVNWVKVNYDGIVTTSGIVSCGGIIWKHDRSMMEICSHGRIWTKNFSGAKSFIYY
jgi:hypothetical protein